MNETIGFIGLGVMGEPICRNIARKSDRPVVAFDVRPEPLQRLTEVGVRPAESIQQLAKQSDFIFLSLPGGEQVRQVVIGDGGILYHAREGATVIDTSTCPVDVEHEVAEALKGRGIDFADSPVARTRTAAEDGTLSIMVGAELPVFERILPLLAAAATDITHCGPIGCGQVVKILNNMVLIETVMALGEAASIGRRAGVAPEVLFDALSKGSADSFALRNHGMKSMVPSIFPEGAFSTKYAQKDLGYALRLAGQTGVKTPGAQAAEELLALACDKGFDRAYFPALVKVLDSE